MSKQRFSISIDDKLGEQLDLIVEREGYKNRSQAISRILNEKLGKHQVNYSDGLFAGTLTLTYDHHNRNVQSQLTAIQHDYLDNIIAATHVHLTHSECMEVLLVKGKSKKLKQLEEKINKIKSVSYSELNIKALA